MQNRTRRPFREMAMKTNDYNRNIHVKGRPIVDRKVCCLAIITLTAFVLALGIISPWYWKDMLFNKENEETMKSVWDRERHPSLREHRWKTSYPPLKLQHTYSEEDEEEEAVFSALSFLLPASQRRVRLMQRIQKVLQFGTRVAGSFSPGHRKMLEFIAAEGQWQPQLTTLFNPAVIPPSPRSNWRLEWDNFTSETPLGARWFFNLVFHFEGGHAFRQESSKETKKKEATTVKRPRRSFAAAAGGRNGEGKSSMAREKLRHVVLAAHWDSKYFAEFDFLGACDSAVSVVYLLETMRMITVLSETSEILQSLTENAEKKDVCTQLRYALSPAYREILLYYYADDDEVIHCLSGNRTTRTAGNGTEDENVSNREENFGVGDDGGGGGVAWQKLLRHVSHLPAITVIFFDGEEAFVRWYDDDHTYGSRHLAQQWKKKKMQPVVTDAYNGADNTLSYFDSIDLFVLYDLMGPAETQFHNYFPDQSGMAFALLVDVEEAHRLRAERLSCIVQQFMREKENCSSYLPEIWCQHGTPHEMYTLSDAPCLMAPLRPHIDNAEKWFPSNGASQAHSIGLRDRNLFFPMEEKLAQGSRLDNTFAMEDDHIHWMDTQRVLHLIPWPFPPSWHTVRDDGREIDEGTVMDLLRVLEEFVLYLGEGWIHS
ncbi:glutaminyl cyclase, putative [Trypanosoma cruzi]|nr:glutaminyl cyclase, putative [Trypanosoma cruzi]